MSWCKFQTADQIAKRRFRKLRSVNEGEERGVEICIKSEIDWDFIAGRIRAENMFFSYVGLKYVSNTTTARGNGQTSRRTNGQADRRTKLLTHIAKHHGTMNYKRGTATATATATGKEIRKPNRIESSRVTLWMVPLLQLLLLLLLWQLRWRSRCCCTAAQLF